MWKHLSHPHIVPFMGVTLEPLQFVSKWMPGGDIREYVRKNPDANRARLVSQVLPTLDVILSSPQLLGVAEGLSYLHSSNVIHKDLKGVRCITYFSAFLLTDTNSAEHNGRRIRPGTNHGLRSRCHRPELAFVQEHSRGGWIHTSVVCTRSANNRTTRQQGI